MSTMMEVMDDLCEMRDVGVIWGRKLVESLVEVARCEVCDGNIKTGREQ